MAVFEVSRLALAAELPTEHPAVIDEVDALVDQFPDREVLYAEARAGSFRSGNNSAAHVGVITAEAPRITGFANIESQVVTIAERVEPGELRRLLRLPADQCRPEARDEQAQALHAKRCLSLSCSRCHHDLHFGQYTITMGLGIPSITPPHHPGTTGQRVGRVFTSGNTTS
jgi:hypothetical protein